MTTPRRDAGVSGRPPRVPRNLWATFTGGPLGTTHTFLVGVPTVIAALGCGLAVLQFPPGDATGEWLYKAMLTCLCLFVIDMVVASIREWLRRRP